MQTVHGQTEHRQALTPLPLPHQALLRLGFMGADGVPTPRAAFWVPLTGSMLLGGGMALWLFN